jgi:sulfur carrier protein ThiS
MENNARMRFHTQEWQVCAGRTIRDAIVKLGLDPYEVLALRGKQLVNDQTVIQPGDEIRLVNVISGG